MKRIISKRTLFILGILFPICASAQNIDFAGPANQIGNQIKQITPIVLGIGFIVACFFNMKHFMGENADVKKGITNILIFAIIIGVMYGLIRSILSMSI